MAEFVQANSQSLVPPLMIRAIINTMTITPRSMYLVVMLRSSII